MTTPGNRRCGGRSWLALAIVLAVVIIWFAPPPPVDCNKVGSYYTPAAGTVNTHSSVEFCTAPSVTGRTLPFPIVVDSDVEGSVKRIEPDGRIKWKYTDSERPRSIRRTGPSEAEFVSGRYLIKIDLETGDVLSSKRTSSRYRCADRDIVCEADGIRVLSLDRKIPASSPRDAVRVGQTVYVADTFAHRVFAYDLDTNHITFEEQVYYPNDIQLLDERTLLVAAEHENRVLKIDLRTSSRTIVAGCNIDPFSDPSSKPQDIVASEQSGRLTRPDSRSVCAGAMYSPNGAVQHTNGTYLVSDTDNHRVLWLDRDGTQLSSIGPFNNPVRAFFLD